MEISNLSILVNSFNTAKVLETCLKSWKKHNSNLELTWLISENSTDEETALLLDSYSIPYFRNKGMRHSDGVDFLIRQCKTKYALLIDSDIVFRKNISALWDKIKDIDFVLAGERCGDRGGKFLYPRIQPWFCFMNTNIIKQHDFKMGDDIVNQGKLPIDRLWDIGSKLYNDCLANHFLLVDMEKDMDAFYYHYEGMSWRKNNPNFRQMGLYVENTYQREIDTHKDINLEKPKMDLLTELGIKYNTDKATFHKYTEKYNRVFEPIRFEIKNLLEIGVFRGESIKMWLDYFPNAIVSCIDINDMSSLFKGNERVKFYQCPQAQFKTEEQFDFILDDGSHFMNDQQITFLNLFNNFKRYYIVEDLQTSMLQEYGFNGNNSTIDFLKKLQSENKIKLDILYKNSDDKGGSITSFIQRV